MNFSIHQPRRTRRVILTSTDSRVSIYLLCLVPQEHCLGQSQNLISLRTTFPEANLHAPRDNKEFVSF